MKRLYVVALIVIVVATAAVSAHAQTVQCLTTNGAWGPCPLNASVQLFNAVSATGPATATAQKVYNFNMNGTLIITYASITGSPSGCALQVKSGDSLGNLINNGSAVSTTPSSGTTSVAFTPANGQMSADQISIVYSCTAYPSAGNLSLEFVPATVSVPVSSSGYQKVDLAANDVGTLPVNVGQVAGASVSTVASGTQKVGVADAAGNGITSNSTTYTSNHGLDQNLLGTLGTAFSTPGKIDITAIPAGTNNIGKIDIVGNSGQSLDASISAGSAPSNGLAIIGQYNSSAPAPSNNQTVAMQLGPNGNLVDQPYRRSQIITTAGSIATSSGTQSTLITGITGTYIDITSLVITTASSATGGPFTASITDSTNTYVFDLNQDNANGASTIAITFNPPLLMSSTGQSWKQTNSTTVTTHTTVVAVKQTANF